MILRPAPTPPVLRPGHPLAAGLKHAWGGELACGRWTDWVGGVHATPTWEPAKTYDRLGPTIENNDTAARYLGLNRSINLPLPHSIGVTFYRPGQFGQEGLIGRNSWSNFLQTDNNGAFLYRVANGALYGPAWYGNGFSWTGWCAVVLTNDASFIRVYNPGGKASTMAYAGSSWFTITRLLEGAPTNWLNGAVGTIHLWSRALSHEEAVGWCNDPWAAFRRLRRNWTAFTIPVVVGPFEPVEAQAFIPGADDAEAFIPGAAKAQAFIPGAVAAEGSIR